MERSLPDPLPCTWIRRQMAFCFINNKEWMTEEIADFGHVTRHSGLEKTIMQDQQEDWEGRFDSRPSHGSCVDKPQTVCEDKYGSIQCLCSGVARGARGPNFW